MPDAGRQVERARQESGSALPKDLRADLGNALGTALPADVRVHTGAASSDAAQAIGAKAYTEGADIHFGAGQYDPASTSGRQLIAHEVAHTVQQQGASGPPQRKPVISAPGDTHEREADAFADSFVAGDSGERGYSFVSLSTAPSMIARDALPDADAGVGWPTMTVTAVRKDGSTKVWRGEARGVHGGGYSLSARKMDGRWDWGDEVLGEDILMYMSEDDTTGQSPTDWAPKDAVELTIDVGSADGMEDEPATSSREKKLPYTPEDFGVKDVDEGETKKTGPLHPDVQPQFDLTFRGPKNLIDVSGAWVDGSELPDVGDLWRLIEALRALETQYAAAAWGSVADRPDMLPMEFRDTKSGTEMELPSEFIDDPPTNEIALLVALHTAVAVAEMWARTKQEWNERTDIVLDEVAPGQPRQGTKKQIEQQRQQLINDKMLQALTGTFGGVVGMLVADFFSDDPAMIAEGAVTGMLVTDSISGKSVEKTRKRDGKTQQGRRKKPGKGKKKPTSTRRKGRKKKSKAGVGNQNSGGGQTSTTLTANKASALIDASHGRQGNGTVVGHANDHIPPAGASPAQAKAHAQQRPNKKDTTVYRHRQHAVKDLRDALNAHATDVAALTPGQAGFYVEFNLAKPRPGYNSRYGAAPADITFATVSIYVEILANGTLHLDHFSPRM